MKEARSWKAKRLSKLVMLLAVICLQWVLLSNSALAATIVFGRISGNVRWTPENSPYIVSRDIIVAQGSTLTIAAGTEVRFRRFQSSHPYTNRGVLKVLGTLKVEGTQENRVYFGLFEDGGIGEWGGIWVDGYFGGHVIMEYAQVEKAERGVYVSGGSPVIKQSRFSSNITGIHLEQTSDFNVEGNITSGNNYGFYLDSSQGVLQKNAVISNTWGIYSFLSRGIAITHNAVKSNTFGIINDGGMQDVIEYNDFSIRKPNDYAVYLVKGKPTRINNNNFFYDPEIVADPFQVFWYVWNDDNAGDVDAKHNWWDTLKPEIIEAYIMDRRDRPYLGLVNYLPFAQSPIRGTADDISAPMISIRTVSPFSPVAYAGGQMVVTYSLSETVALLRARIIDSNGLMGSSGAELWIRKWEGDSELLRDGQHAWMWDARLASGKVLVDGTYRIEMVAEDKDVKGLFSDVAHTQLIIDSIPPELTITFPEKDDYKLRSNSLTMQGTVKDANMMGGFVLVRERRLSDNVRASLDGTDWQALVPRLSEGLNILEVNAWDGAGNRADQQRIVIYEPVMDLRIKSPTNEDSQVIQGAIREQFLGQISKVQVLANDQYFTAKLDGREFETPVPVPLVLGDNTIQAIAYDNKGDIFGEVIAVIEYDPLWDITVTGHFPAGLQMVSVPMTPFDYDPTVIFEQPGLAQPPLARWQYVDGIGPGYVYDGEELEQVTPYRGYWWKPNLAISVPVNGKAYDPAKGFQFPLNTGWNQIGCPFLRPVQWDKVLFALEQGRALSWQEAVSEGWISRGLWTYRDGGYVLSTTLQPWAGYWVLARRDLQVVIPPEAVDLGEGGSLLSAKGMRAWSSSQGGGLAVVGSDVTKAVGLGIGGWNLQLSITAGKVQDRYNYLGVAPGARRGFDPTHDLEKPPPAQGPTLWLGARSSTVSTSVEAVGGKGVFQDVDTTVASSTAAGDGLRLAADYRRLDELLVWDVFIDNGSNTEDIVLSWAGNWNPTQWQLILVDPAANSQLSLSTYGARTCSLAPGEIKHLQVQATSVGGELALLDVLPYPNPWNMVQPLKLRFTITQPASVEARIYDAAGKLVRILPAEERPAGRHYLPWDGRNGRGRIAANGLYFYQVMARPLGGGRIVKVQGRLAILR